MLRVFALVLATSAAVANAADDTPPRSLDPRVTISLFAENPQIVTPTGMDVDHLGRVWAIESNTHFPPEGYKGHPTDRLLVMSDKDGDGRADQIAVFADGFTHSMSVAVKPVWLTISRETRDPKAPDALRLPDAKPESVAAVFLATRREISLLIDEDGDLKADRRERLIHLDTPGNYPHNGLAGFAFDALGWMYFGFGENLGANYKIIARDGTTLSGGGEGGNIYRCRPDGTGLTQIATGFWNPHASCVDAFGRLFTVDNDADSRPPCRLLHVIPEGDYGYRFRNGRKGLHPFTAWNGEVPGTLPMVAGTGEAPSGIVAYESDGLPDEYRGQLFVTSWGDHRIDRFKLVPRGASFQSLAEPLITGGEEFRPVGLAVAPDGSMYCTDWVKRDYKLHGHGRVWRIATTKSRAGETENVVRLGMRKIATEELQTLLRSPRLDIRRSVARRLCSSEAERKEMLAFVKDPKQPARSRIEGLWALLDGTSFRDEPANVAAANPFATRDEVSTAAGWAIGLPGFKLDDAAVRKELNLLLGMLLSDEIDPRLDRGLSLPLLARTEWADGDRLVQAALSIRDPFVNAVMIPALAKRLSADEFAKYLNPGAGTAPEIAQVMVLAARKHDPKDVTLVTMAIGHPDADVRRLAVQWIAEEKLSAQRPQVEAVLNKANLTSDLLLATLAGLELLDGVNPAAFDQTPASKYVLAILRDSKRPASLHAQVLRLVQPTAPELTAPMLRGFLASDDAKLRLEAVRTLQASLLPEAPALLRELATNDKEQPIVRGEAAVGLAFALTRKGEEAASRTAIESLLVSPEPVLRAEGLRATRGQTVNSSELRGAVAKVAGQLPQAGTRPADEDRDLAEQIALALTGSKEPLPERVEKLKPKRPASKTEWMATLARGRAVDTESGRRLFYHPNGPGCFKCHTIDGRGGRIGPDLSNVVRSMNRPQLIESILEPSREIAPQFVSWSFTMKDGRVLIGMIVQENEGKLVIGDAEGKTIDVKTADVEERVPQKISVMPEKLPERMTLQEFRDLLAFLESVR